MNCNIHTDREATGTCTYCGKFFCADCLVEINGRNYCRDHVNNAVQSQTAATAATAAAQPNIIINNTNTNTNTNGYSNMFSTKSRLVSLLLCFFLGFLGIHRFYAGKIGTGILYFVTMGFFGIGILIDLVSLLFGTFRDSYGYFIKNW